MPNDIDWYQLVLTAGAAMPTWSNSGVWCIVRANEIYIQLIGNMEEVFLKVTDEHNFHWIPFFRVQKLYNCGVNYGFQFEPILSRHDFNVWKDTVGGLFERAASNLSDLRRK
jgi:hypothetical protein